jgi:soluble lytic murein transglycosylase-like protein
MGDIAFQPHTPFPRAEPPNSWRLPQSDTTVDESIVTWWILVFLTQDPRAQADRARAAMAESLATQRASVRGQLQAVRPAKPIACEPVSPPELKRMIDGAALRHNVDPLLVREVAREESGFRPCAVSPRGAEGLMQLMPATQALFQVRNPFSAQQSLEAGSKLLKLLLDRYHGDLSQALSAYNAGPARVDQAGVIPEIPETKSYVSDILSRIGP